jgi:hypothetical protein
MATSSFSKKKMRVRLWIASVKARISHQFPQPHFNCIHASTRIGLVQYAT